MHGHHSIRGPCGRLAQARLQAEDFIDLFAEFPDALGRLFERGFFLGSQIKFEYFFDAGFPQAYRHAHIGPFQAVLAVTQRGTGQHLVFITDNRLHHFDHGRPRVRSTRSPS